MLSKKEINFLCSIKDDNQAEIKSLKQHEGR